VGLWFGAFMLFGWLFCWSGLACHIDRKLWLLK
jgi:hypothetical protein